MSCRSIRQHGSAVYVGVVVGVACHNTVSILGSNMTGLREATVLCSFQLAAFFCAVESTHEVDM